MFIATKQENFFIST